MYLLLFDHMSKLQLFLAFWLAYFLFGIFDLLIFSSSLVQVIHKPCYPVPDLNIIDDNPLKNIQNATLATPLRLITPQHTLRAGCCMSTKGVTHIETHTGKTLDHILIVVSIIIISIIIIKITKFLYLWLLLLHSKHAQGRDGAGMWLVIIIYHIHMIWSW